MKFNLPTKRSVIRKMSLRYSNAITQGIAYCRKIAIYQKMSKGGKILDCQLQRTGISFPYRPDPFIFAQKMKYFTH